MEIQKGWEMEIQEFLSAGKILFGNYSYKCIGKEASSLGKKALLVTGKKAMKAAGITDQVARFLREAGLGVEIFDEVESDPSIQTIDGIVEILRKEKCDLVVGLGGGSPLDAAKAAAGIAPTAKSVRDYLEGREEMKFSGLPFVALPTTAGTGSEVTRNSVVTNREEKTKSSFRSSYLLAKLAIVDPVLTLTAPPLLTATTGLDALTHLIESYVSTQAWSLTDGLAIYGIELVACHLAQAVTKGSDLTAREGMAMASLIGGLALSNSGLGAVHGLAHPLGAHYGISHGMVNGILLSYVMEYNLEICREKFTRIARIFGEEPQPEKAVEAVRNLTLKLGIPLHLREFGVEEKNLSRIAREALPAGSTRYNPRPLEEEDLIAILKRAY